MVKSLFPLAIVFLFAACGKQSCQTKDINKVQHFNRRSTIDSLLYLQERDTLTPKDTVIINDTAYWMIVES